MATPDERRGARTRLARIALDLTPLRASRDFRLLWAGLFVSEIGYQFTRVALYVQVYALTGTPASPSMTAKTRSARFTSVLLGEAAERRTVRRVDRVELGAERREGRIAEEQARASGKPDNIVQRMVEGKVESYYKDNCLVYQPWIREPKKSIGELIKEASAKVGENIQVRRFVRFQMGEE